MEPVAIEADVLVIGGGMAAAWAAISAAREGADTVMVDKGFVGTSGVTASGGPNHWWVPPDQTLRRAAIEARLKSNLGLSETAWMERVLDATWRTLPQLATYYPFATDGRGGTFYSGVRGPEYMRALRNCAVDSGVRILDHHPALELLTHRDGSVAGAAGYARLSQRPWSARAGAVIMTTGGCAFRSGLIGSYNNTGDGYLMAAEAGAELSGMEFCVAYSLSPVWCSTRTMPYTSARFYDAGGRELDIPPTGAGWSHYRALGEAMEQGPVLADLVDAPEALKTHLRRIQPLSPPPFERRGVDLFGDRFEVTLFGEGTVRGTGGLRVVDDDCQTDVRNLYAAGDAATRELVAGATSGGGAVNSAWALTSGLTAGAAAAARARRDGRRQDDAARPVGQAGLRPGNASRVVDEAAAVQLAQTQILPTRKALSRSAPSLQASAEALDDAWAEIVAHHRSEGLGQVAAREAAAMLATARWCVAGALARTESRGMHLRIDASELSPDLARRLRVGGLDEVWTRFEGVDERRAVA